MKLLLRLGLLLLVFFGGNVASNAYVGSFDRHTSRGDKLLNMCFTASNTNVLTTYYDRKVPDFSSTFTNEILPSITQDQSLSGVNFGSGFNASQVYDYGLFTINFCVWPRSGVTGLFDFQVFTVYRILYLDASGNAHYNTAADFLIGYGFYGVFRCDTDITSTNFDNLTFTYVSDDVMFPFFGSDYTWYHYSNYDVRQYPIGYNGRTSVNTITGAGQKEFTSFAYGTIEELASIFSVYGQRCYDWGPGKSDPVKVYFFHGSGVPGWFFPQNNNSPVQSPPIIGWRSYDYDQGTESDAHEFYVKHDREDPLDDWGDIPGDDTLGGTVELGPSSQEYISEQLDEYFGDDNSSVNFPSLPSSSSALEYLEDPDEPVILTETQYNGAHNAVGQKINAFAVGLFRSRVENGLGQQTANSLPVFSVHLPSSFSQSTFDVDFNFLRQSPYNTYFNFLRTLVVMIVFCCCIIFIFKDIRDSLKD